jgi:hypothetical protein
MSKYRRPCVACVKALPGNRLVDQTGFQPITSQMQGWSNPRGDHCYRRFDWEPSDCQGTLLRNREVEVNGTELVPGLNRLKTAVFWDTALCSLVNVDKLTSDHTARHPRRQLSCWPPREPLVYPKSNLFTRAILTSFS